MNITVIGSGYVGLVSGSCFSTMGNKVTCVDIDPVKIEKLNQGIIPIFEPGLDEIVKRCRGKNLFFSTEVHKCISEADMIFISVNTPIKKEGINFNAIQKKINFVIEKFIWLVLFS